MTGVELKMKPGTIAVPVGFVTEIFPLAPAPTTAIILL
jgi:hypothetical protein